MFRRFTIAILSIIISGLKLICNMLSLLIQFITKQEMPLFGNVDERDEESKEVTMLWRTIENTTPMRCTKIQSSIKWDLLD